MRFIYLIKNCFRSRLFGITIYSIFILIPFLLFFMGCDVIMPADVSQKEDIEEITSIESELDEESVIEDTEASGSVETGEEDKADEASPAEDAEPEPQEKIINVYYIDEQAQYLIGEERKITGIYVEDLIEEAFNELLKEPSKENVFNLIPVGTEIINAEFVDGYAYLNLTSEFVENKWNDGIVDRLVINCIAATLTEIPGINGVLFLIEGEKLDKYGSLDISNPAERNADLIKE